MSSPQQEMRNGLATFLAIVGWLLAGAVIGLLLAQWVGPVSPAIMMTSALSFPAIVFAGWSLMLLLALLSLPFQLPALLRWLREPLRSPRTQPLRPQRRVATAVGWAFVVAAVPIAGIAGVLAGAPFTYVLAGLAYGYALRHSAALQDVQFE